MASNIHCVLSTIDVGTEHYTILNMSLWILECKHYARFYESIKIKWAGRSVRTDDIVYVCEERKWEREEKERGGANQILKIL